MNILICTAEYETAITGAAGFAKMFGEWGLRNSDQQVHILSEDCSGGQHTQHPCKVNFWSRVPVVNYYFKSKSYSRCLKAVLAKQSFDVIYFNDIWLAYGARRWLSRSKAQSAIVAFMHDDNTMDIPQKFRFNGASLSYLVRWWMERSVVRILDTVLVNSEYLKTRVQDKFQLSSSIVRRLYYTAHDYAQIAFEPERIDPEKPVRILFAKHDFARGGLYDLLSALGSLQRYQFSVTVVGSPKERILRKIKPNLLDQPNVRIQMIGGVSSWSEMQELYRAHDVFCVPSRKEALGLANAEALSSGTAVVTTTAGGIPEVLNHGKNGYTCNPGAVEELANAILECITMDATTRAKTEAGRAFVLERFGVDTMFSELENILTASVAQARQKQVRERK